MPPDLPNQQEIALKKRARRRLVGAIALVLLMVIVLPRILQDRATLAAQQPLKVTMTASSNEAPSASDLTLPNEKVVEMQEALTETSALNLATQPEMPQADMTTHNMTLVPPANKESQQPARNQPMTIDPAEKSNLVQNTDEQLVTNVSKKNAEEVPKKTALKASATDSKKVSEASQSKPRDVSSNNSEPIAPDLSERKVGEDKVAKADHSQSKTTTLKSPQSASAHFSVQVGVFSDAENVKQLQVKLKEIGYTTRTEKLATPKGEKIRLRAGHFSSRQEAQLAQAKIKKIGLASMVVAND